MPPKTPSGPSKSPPLRTESTWEPTSTAGASGSRPSLRPNRFPTASSRTASPASRMYEPTRSLASRSSGVKERRGAAPLRRPADPRQLPEPLPQPPAVYHAASLPLVRVARQPPHANVEGLRGAETSWERGTFIPEGSPNDPDFAQTKETMTLEVYEIEPSGVAVEVFWTDFEPL